MGKRKAGFVRTKEIRRLRRAVRKHRALVDFAANLPPELRRVVGDELLAEQFFAYWRKWEAET
jgi:hypothetical protein